MPMYFPDMPALLEEANVHSFRQPHQDEREEDYRFALARHVFRRDPVEGIEVLAGRGWDAIDAEEFLLLRRRLQGV